MTIKELRTNACMTQKEFAEYFGIPKRTVENWESKNETSARECPEYLINLMEYKLINEHMIITAEQKEEYAHEIDKKIEGMTIDDAIRFFQVRGYTISYDNQVSQVRAKSYGSKESEEYNKAPHMDVTCSYYGDNRLEHGLTYTIRCEFNSLNPSYTLRHKEYMTRAYVLRDKELSPEKINLKIN